MRRPARLLAATLLLTAGLAGCLAAEEATETLPTDGDAVFSWTHVFPGTYDTKQHRALEPGPYDVLSQETLLVPSALDGADIMIHVVRPAVPEGTRVPVIANAGPYFPPMHGRHVPEENPFVETFVKHGYALALVSVRGTGDSGGCMDLMGPAERHDIDQAVTWLGTAEWSNGNVGMFGGSYDGSTQWQAASTGNPHLKTIYPLAGIPDLFTHQIRNGTFQAWTPAQFAAAYWAFYGPLLYNPATGRSPENTASQLVCPESNEGMAVSVHSALSGERDPLGFWDERDWRDEILENYRGSIYLAQGFADVTVEPHNAYPFVTELEERGVVVKHVLGHWGHELPWRADWLEHLKRWYDRWLKCDPPTGLTEGCEVDIGPKAQVQDNVGLWRSERAWPPADAVPRVFHLADGLRLSPDPVAGGEPVLLAATAPVHGPDAAMRLNGWWKLWEDPLVEVCAACPTFATEPLEHDLRFAGMPRVHLLVVPSGPGGHVTALLYRLGADGGGERIGYGAIDLRFADGGTTPRDVTPNAPIEVRLELQPTDAVVPAGDRLALVLHQGGHGIRMPSATPFPVRVLVADGASVLVVDAFERGPEDFHEAPPRVGPVSPPR